MKPSRVLAWGVLVTVLACGVAYRVGAASTPLPQNTLRVTCMSDGTLSIFPIVPPVK